VPGAIPGSAGRDDLSLRIHEFSHKQSILIIDSINIVAAEVARFFWSLNLLLIHVFH
jgi:hypothetical protein